MTFVFDDMNTDEEVAAPAMEEATETTTEEETPAAE